jgi:hypothetical protein
MALDPVLAAGVQPVQFDNPMNQLAQLLQIQQAQKQGQLADLNMQTAQRGFDEQNKLRDYFAKGNFDSPDFVRGLYSISPDKAMAYDKTRLDSQKDQAEIKAKEATTNAAIFKLATDREQGYKLTLVALHDNPNLSKPLAVAAMQSKLQQGLITPEMFAHITNDLPDDPSALRQQLNLGLRELLTPEQKVTLFAPKPVEQTNGQVKTTIDQNPLSPTYGKPTGAPAVQMRQTPDNAATVAASIGNNIRSVGASYDNASATRAVAAATRDAASIQAGFAAEQGLRKEFEGLPEVKNYKQAYPAYAAVADAAGRNTPQSDINLVYGIARLYDPNSVVREGEYATVANSPNIPERIKGFAQYLAGGGRLSPETKRQIVAEAQGRMGTYEAEAQKAKSSYETIARNRGMDPASVFADMGNITTNPNARPPGAAPGAPASPANIRAQADAILRGGK